MSEPHTDPTRSITSSGSEVIDPDPLLLAEGSSLGRYTLWEELGAGGMATVYRATVDGPGGLVRPVALKLVHPHLAQHPAFVTMFLDEARVLSRIAHPSVCSIVDFGEAGGTFFMAIEYLDGVPLGELSSAVAARSSLLHSERWCALASQIIAAACEGLHAAHELRDERGRSLRVVHRDVSPPNLFVTRGGAVKVMDFGVAYAADRAASATQPGVIKGKYAYVAPEQLAGRIDRRVDVWAAGVCLWELLTGRCLFSASSALETISQVATADIVPPSSYNLAVPPELDAIVLRALARTPEERYRTARDFAQALDRFARGVAEPLGLCALADLMAILFPRPSFPHGDSTTVPAPLLCFDEPTTERKPAARAPRGDEPTRVAKFTSSAIEVSPRRWVLRAALAIAVLASALVLVWVAFALEQRAPRVRMPREGTASTRAHRRAERASTASERASAIPLEDRTAVLARAQSTVAPEVPSALPPIAGPADEAATESPAEWGTLHVVTPRGSADVYEGAEHLGRSPGRFRLRAGLHTLRLIADGDRPSRTIRVRVRPGRRTRWVADLH